MTGRSTLATRLARFWADESATATVEFVIVFPVVMTIFASAYEIGLANVRHVMLERATDVVVRELRLGTGADLTYEDMKTRLCEVALIIPACDTALKLELVPVSTASWDWPEVRADCVDRAAAVNPVRQWENGIQNELMMVRACIVVDPLFPAFGLGATLPKDETGGYRLVATSGFVNEPL